MLYTKNLVMTGTAAETFVIPTGAKFVSIVNNTNNTLHLFDDIRTVNDDDVRDVIVIVPPFTSLSVPLTQSLNYTVVFITGGGAGLKTAQLMFSDVNLGINTQMGAPGTNQNVNVQTDSVGLAKQEQLPNALTGLGNLRTEVMNTVPITIAGEVEIKNDTGSPISITSTQLASIITLLTDLNSKLDTANAHLAAIETNTTP